MLVVLVTAVVYTLDERLPLLQFNRIKKKTNEPAQQGGRGALVCKMNCNRRLKRQIGNSHVPEGGGGHMPPVHVDFCSAN